jgi:predicted RNA-binding protein
MIKLELISVRPINKNVDRFHTSDDGIREYIKKNFQDTGKLVSMTSSTSEDYSTQTRTFIFESQEGYDEFSNDEVLQYQTVLRDRYNTYHHITFEQFVTTV